MTAVADWLSQTRSVYLDNATSRRDFRVQLRGSRSVLLFAIYLAILILFAYVTYSNSAMQGTVEVVEAQRRLQQFYSMVMVFMGGLISVVSPALTATTIVTERQRRSLDLVFSAPVSPRYYLVGKMISSFRFTWMLLILSLPVTAACVVLGGATWQDVIVSYVLLSIQGLILTSLGLLLSTLAPKALSAIVWSYGASILYLSITSVAGASAIARTFAGGSSNEAPFFSALNPFLVQVGATSYTLIWDTRVPNWILVGLFAVLICKLCLLGAGVMISAQPQKEIVGTRTHALAYSAAFLLYVFWLNSGTAHSMLGTYSSSDVMDIVGRIICICTLPLVIFIPFLSTFAVDAEKRYWPNGWFSLRNIFDGRPAGGLPYILLYILTTALAITIGVSVGGHEKPRSDLLIWTMYTCGLWGFFWAVGRFFSSMFTGLRPARMLVLASMLLIVLLPLPFFSALAEAANTVSGTSKVWNLYPLSPLTREVGKGTSQALVWGLVFILAAAIVAWVAERRTQRTMIKLGNRYE